MKRIVLLVMALALVMLAGNGLAAGILGAMDFLPEDAAEPYYYYGDRETGYWEYVDQELRITIHRLTDEEENITWFETDIRCKDTARFTTYMQGGDEPGGSLVSPKVLAEDAGAVLMFSDDYFGVRRMTGGVEGIILRGGVVFADETIAGGTSTFPPLEVLAIYADGRMGTFASDAYSAAEYLAMGVTDTYAFGPILVKNGMLGERMFNEKYGAHREPRCALGMIEPGHYVLLTVKGRTEDSGGVKLRWLADRMLALGAVEALNLDGGATTALSIMGDLISHPEDVTRKGVRGVNTLIGIGVQK